MPPASSYVHTGHTLGQEEKTQFADLEGLVIKTSVERDCLSTWPQTQALSDSSLPSSPGYERQGCIRNLPAVPTLETSLLPPCYSPSQRCLEERQGGGGGQAALQDPARTKAASAPPTALAGWVTRIQMALLNRRLGLSLTHRSSMVIQRHFSITGACRAIQKLTRVRVVDNSALGNTPYHRPPKCIHVYNKTGVGKVGDTILLAIKGEKKKALIVGHKMPGPPMTPRFDSNNVVLIEDNGNPIGTRIKTPIPYILRQREGEFSKVLAIARNFV
ncbi:39S ribosomal protein L14, mitochondrial isoform X1 [Harpia harpyja]|uniref:39S ribosomal protein L14, mitochondrial isoform X1 n=1 Tax=Harpia harpyja TaxID=202280 RepID=UPI0022B1C643|nr:39S ribosomal protein L14, mitochondrial isoform X1 [Harpia harpyja]